jgi:hypothetical protein
VTVWREILEIILKPPMRNIYSKRKEFQAEIRRQHIEQRITALRRMNDLDFTTPDDLARKMGMPLREYLPYSLLELLRQNHEELLKLPFGLEMEPEGEIPFPLDIHILFWKLYSEQLNRDEAQFDPLLGMVLLDIIKKYTYAQVHENTAY